MESFLTQEFQLNRLNASLSDPDGWTANSDTHSLEHSSGLCLRLRLNELRNRAQLMLDYVSMRVVWSQEEGAFTQHFLDDCDVVCSFEFEQLVTLRTDLKLPEHASRIPADLMPVFEAPSNINHWLASCETEIAAALYVWQRTLHLHCMSAGRAAYQAAQAALVLHILQRPDISAESVVGDWILYSDRTLESPRHTHIWNALTHEHMQELYRPILNYGYPCVSLPGRDLDDIPEFYVTDRLFVSIPESAHARAALLRQT